MTEPLPLGHASSALVQTGLVALAAPHLLSPVFVSVVFQNPQPRPRDWSRCWSGSASDPVRSSLCGDSGCCQGHALQLPCASPVLPTVYPLWGRRGEPPVGRTRQSRVRGHTWEPPQAATLVPKVRALQPLNVPTVASPASQGPIASPRDAGPSTHSTPDAQTGPTAVFESGCWAVPGGEHAHTCPGTPRPGHARRLGRTRQPTRPRPVDGRHRPRTRPGRVARGVRREVFRVVSSSCCWWTS